MLRWRQHSRPPIQYQGHISHVLTECHYSTLLTITTMGNMKRRDFILLAGSAAISAAIIPTLSSCEGKSRLTTFSLKDSPLPDSVKNEIGKYNQQRNVGSEASIEDLVREDYGRFKTVWLGRDLLAYSQFV